jgi:uncharacterized membrane protein YvbJ
VLINKIYKFNKQGISDKMKKIWWILIAILLIILIIAGITAWQAYGLVQTVQAEQASIETNLAALQKGDCSKVAPLESSMGKITSKAQSACWNPIISYGVEKMQQIPIKCSNISALDQQFQSGLVQIKAACAKKTA